MENIRHCYIAISLLYLSNQENKTTEFAIQVCGNKKSLAVAEVQKITANVPQACGFAVAKQRLFTVPSTAEKAFNCSVRGQKKYCTGRTFSFALHQQRNYHLSFLLVLLMETLRSVFAAASFFGSD